MRHKPAEFIKHYSKQIGIQLTEANLLKVGIRPDRDGLIGDAEQLKLYALVPKSEIPPDIKFKLPFPFPVKFEYAKGKDTILIRRIVNKKSFQEDLKELRKNCNIPQAGFQNNKKYGTWSKKNWTEYRELLPKIRKKVITIRKQYKLEKLTPKEMAEEIKKVHWLSLQNKWVDLAKQLMKKHKIPERFYFPFLMSIIFFNKYPEEDIPTEGCRIVFEESLNKNKHIYLEIFSNTSQQEVNDCIKEYWEKIKEYQKQLFDFRKKNLKEDLYPERNEKIYQLKQSNYSYKEVYEEMRKKYPDLTINHIKKICGIMKKRYDN